MKLPETVRTEISWYIKRNLVHSIHTSSRRSFRGCRRRYDWTVRQKIYPKVTARPLEFGVAFHAAMESFYQPEFWNKDPESQRAAALQVFKHTTDEQLKNYRRLNGEPDFEKLEDYKDRVHLGLNMLSYYIDTVSPQYDKGFKPVRVEVPFEVPIYGPSAEIIWCRCGDCWSRQMAYEIVDYNSWQGLPATYGGRLDMLAEDEHGRYWIFDWKTTSSLMNEGDEAGTLDLDDQIASYLWALRDHYGINVVGFVYVEIRKAYPDVPQPLTRLYKGRSYSTDKTFFTTFQIASEFLAANDTTAYADGAYDDYLQWLLHNGPKFHQRHAITKNDYEVGQIGLNIYYEALDMISNPRIYPMPGRFACRNCAYRQPCLGQNQGEDYIYTLNTLFERREKHYFEDNVRTTD